MKVSLRTGAYRGDPSTGLKESRVLEVSVSSGAQRRSKILEVRVCRTVAHCRTKAGTVGRKVTKVENFLGWVITHFLRSVTLL